MAEPHGPNGDGVGGTIGRDPLFAGIMAFFEQKGLHIKKDMDDMADWDWGLMRKAAAEFSIFIQANASAILAAKIKEKRIITHGHPGFRPPKQ